MKHPKTLFTRSKWCSKKTMISLHKIHLRLASNTSRKTLLNVSRVPQLNGLKVKTQPKRRSRRSRSIRRLERQELWSKPSMLILSSISSNLAMLLNKAKLTVKKRTISGIKWMKSNKQSKISTTSLSQMLSSITLV